MFGTLENCEVCFNLTRLINMVIHGAFEIFVVYLDPGEQHIVFDYYP